MAAGAASAASFIAANTYAVQEGTAPTQEKGLKPRELTLVVPYLAGGPLDRSARKLTDQTPAMGRIQIMNVTGEGGTTGAAMVARAGARDPLLFMGATATHAVLPWLNPQLPYDPLRDFQPLLLIARIPHVLVMRTELAMQWRIYTLKDLLRLMSKSRQPLRYASGGVGSVGHLSGQVFQKLTRLPLQHLPFTGARPALSALLEGSADLMFDNLAFSLPHIRAGRLKALGLTTTETVRPLPNVPSLSDSIPGMNMSTWFGLFSTAGITETQASRWASAFASTLDKPEIQQYFDNMGVLRANLRLKDFASYVAQEHRRYGQVLRDSHLIA